MFTFRSSFSVDCGSNGLQYCLEILVLNCAYTRGIFMTNLVLHRSSNASSEYSSDHNALEFALEKSRRRSVAKGKTAISLFSGGGGLDIGVEAAGFKTLACIEKDANCCATLSSNQPKYFRHAEIINADVNAVELNALMKRLGLRTGDLDLLFGGPPCQTFSQIGKLQSLND